MAPNLPRLRGEFLYHQLGLAGTRVFAPLEEGLANGEGSLEWSVETTQRFYIDHDTIIIREAYGIIVESSYGVYELKTALPPIPFLWTLLPPLQSFT